jgi:hypothetical protein
MLEPDRDQIEIFVDAIFRHAQAGFVSLRAFAEGSNNVFRKTPIRVISNNLRFLCDAVVDDARRAAQFPKPIVFCPPLATFGNDKTATEQDVSEGLTVTVECDECPAAARAKLEAILGPATVVIRSGGIWNDGNGGAQDKLHLHWRLTQPARGRDDLVKLKRVREICARLVGADPTSIPISHPIRWPGSWHRKAQPRLTEIVACDADVEIELAAALAKLEPLAPTPPRTDDRAAQPGGEWDVLTANILAGKGLHASIARLAMKMLRGGTPEVIAVQMLRATMDASQAPRDDRWRDRYADIPRAVASAGRKLADEQEEAAAAAQPQSAPPPPLPPPPIIGPAPAAGPGPAASSPIDDTLKAFEHWLLLKDPTPILAVLGAVAGNFLPGDPVWLAVIAPPSSAKTEILNATTGLPHVVRAATVTPAGLLSGTPKKQQARGAKGGLLQQIGDFGILVLKDFGSILSMHPETKAETLAALREVFDGSWTRHLGSDGGRTLHWEGKVGLITASTGVIDSHYSVIGAMGDRFLFSRLSPAPGRAQFNRSLEHVGEATKQMRAELAAAVARLFAGRKQVPRPINKNETDRIGEVISLVVRLRGAVERDRRTRELDAIYGAEGTARIGLALERLLAGLDTLGVERGRAMKVVLAVALDSCPPLRRAAYQTVDQRQTVDTPAVATALGLPTNTARRVLEDLVAYSLITRKSQGAGKADLWSRAPWEAEE